MGREDDSVLTVNVDATLSTSKSTTACDNFVFQKPSTWEAWGKQRKLNYTSSGHWLPVSPTSNTDWSYATGQLVALGANTATP